MLGLEAMSCGALFQSRGNALLGVTEAAGKRLRVRGRWVPQERAGGLGVGLSIYLHHTFLLT